MQLLLSSPFSRPGTSSVVDDSAERAVARLLNPIDVMNAKHSGPGCLGCPGTRGLASQTLRSVLPYLAHLADEHFGRVVCPLGSADSADDPDWKKGPATRQARDSGVAALAVNEGLVSLNEYWHGPPVTRFACGKENKKRIKIRPRFPQD